MYHFGIVVSGTDETATGRISAALRKQLPDLFPDYTFEFFEPAELWMLAREKADRLLFRVLGAAVRITGDKIDNLATRDLCETVQAAVDRIVVAARTRVLN
jgi:hypothetical protein